jgi:hypothetical protein
MGWLEDTVWVAERCAGQGLLFEAQVGGSEPRRATCGSAPEVQRAVFRPLRSRDLVIGGAEEAALPRPPIATRVCGKPSVARSGLELGPVEPIKRHRLQDGHLTHPAVRVEVQCHPQCRVDRATLRSCRDMGDGPLLSRQRVVHPSHSSMVAHPASRAVRTIRLEAPECPIRIAQRDAIAFCPRQTSRLGIEAALVRDRLVELHSAIGRASGCLSSSPARV